MRAAARHFPGLRFDDLRHTIITAPCRDRVPDNGSRVDYVASVTAQVWSITSGWRPSGRLLKSRKPSYDARGIPLTHRKKSGRGVRVVEGARLESVCRGNLTEGSNPSLSASPAFPISYSD